MPDGSAALTPAMTYDVVVIGGGLPGAALARDCALRGLSVALFEAEDLGVGRSGAGALIFGLDHTFFPAPAGDVDDARRELAILRRVAPHFLCPVPLLYLAPGDGFPDAPSPAGICERLERQRTPSAPEPDRPPVTLGPRAVLGLEPGIVSAPAGALLFEVFLLSAERLCVLSALHARELGAALYTHTEIVDVAQSEDGRTLAVRARDRITDRAVSVGARSVVDTTRSSDGLPEIVTIVLERRISNFAVVVPVAPRRMLCVVPRQDHTVLTYAGPGSSPGAPDSGGHAAQQLLDEAARVFPAVARTRVVSVEHVARPGTSAGTRPLPALHGAGILPLHGSTLENHRRLAEDMADRVCVAVGRTAACRSHDTPLPGGERPARSERFAEQLDLPAPIAEGIVDRHGERASVVGARMARVPFERSVVCACGGILEAEVRHAVRAELARTVEDVSRRTGLGRGACGGMRCAHRAAQLAAQEQGLRPSAAHDMAARFLVHGLSGRLALANGAQLRQEELSRAALAASGLWTEPREGAP